jgi:hypothetical protein
LPSARSCNQSCPSIHPFNPRSHMTLIDRSQHNPYGISSDQRPLAVMNALRVTATLILLCFSIGCKPSGPSDAVIVALLGAAGSPPLRECGLEVESIVRGQVQISEGRVPPKGEPMFPIRVTYSEISRIYGDRRTNTTNIRCYQNEFGEWRSISFYP